MKKWSLAYAMMVALIGSALVIASSSGPDVAPARLPGPRLAAPTVTASLLNAQAGNFTSAIEIGGTGTTQIGGTAIDSSGNLYVTGGFSGNIVFNTSPQTTLTSTQDDDLFVAKYDSSGHPLWARVANGATGLPPGLSLGGGLALAVDTLGNSYLGGGFVKTLAFKDANNNTLATLNSSGTMVNFEPFVAKYDPNGTLLWAVGGMSGSPQDASDLINGVNGITDIVVDGLGNPYVAGTVAGTNFLGMPVAVAGLSDVVVSRLNPATGTPVWVSVAGGANNDSAMGLGIDTAANLYVMGDINGTATFPTQPPTTLTNNSGEDAFVAKYNQLGQCLWVKQIGGSQMIFGSHLAVNGAGQVYVTGEFQGSVTFGSTALTDSRSGSSEADISGFLAKLDADGQTWLWARQFDALGQRVALDGSGNPYVTGIFFGQAPFGAEHQPTSHMLSSLEGEDQYVAKYDAAGNFQFSKALPGDGEGSENIIDGPDVKVQVIPIRMIYNQLTGAMQISGDFSGTLMLDSITLNSGSSSAHPLTPAETPRHAFIAALTPASPTAVCTASLSQSTLSLSARGGSGNLLVQTGDQCDWSASGSATWIELPPSTSSRGLGALSYTVAANPNPLPRSGHITVSGADFRVLQGANFSDVLATNPFYDYIGKLSARGITSGCALGYFCPDQSITRGQMAVFLVKALGEFNPTPPPTPSFLDVPATHAFYPYIEKLKALKITSGCGGGNFCPDQPINRGQAAVFIIKALGEFSPPSPAQPRFLDVPRTHSFYPFIERMGALGITSGCGGGNYCPESSVTRGQMAVFLVRAFSL